MMFRLLVFCFLFEIVLGSKVLLVFPLNGTSHSILANGYVKNLLEDGHEVTLISTVKIKKDHPKFRTVLLDEKISDMTSNINFEKLINNEVKVDPGLIFTFMGIQFVTTMTDSKVRKLINDPNEKFDVVIAEWMFADSYAGLGTIFNCPFIWAPSSDPLWYSLELINEPPSPSYYSSFFLSSDIPPFNFWQRVQQLIGRLLELYTKRFISDPLEEKHYLEYFSEAAEARGIQLPPWNDVKYNASMMIANSHVSLGTNIALPQNYKPIAGYHIDREVQELPKDIKQILDNAPHGVIYFSMGSNLKSKELPEVLKRDLLELFGSLKETVIWKFEDKLENTPENVHILQWAPQQSVLNHRNCILFITHGGLLSITESVHFGVPIIGMPVFGDQFFNIATATNKGFGIKVNWSYNVKTDLANAIQEMIRNPKYTEKVKELSLVYHDRPVHPADELKHWVRHVIKTKGAPHLRSPALDLYWYQKMYLDLAAFILVIVIALIIVSKKLYRIVIGKKEKLNKKKKIN